MKYTEEDIIRWSDDLRLRKAIGKTCYGSDNPKYALIDAQDDKFRLTLDHVNVIGCPFVVHNEKGTYGFRYIVLRKKEKKIVPFDLSLQEDKDAIKDRWLRSIRFDHELRIVEISDSTVWLGSGNSGYSAEELLSNYVFADTGKPVGKEVEERGR